MYSSAVYTWVGEWGGRGGVSTMHVLLFFFVGVTFHVWKISESKRAQNAKKNLCKAARKRLRLRRQFEGGGAGEEGGERGEGGL